VGQRRAHAVADAHQIVSRLVHEEDRQQRGRERDPVDQHARVRNGVEPRRERRRGGGRDRGQCQQRRVHGREPTLQGGCGRRRRERSGLGHAPGSFPSTATGVPTPAPSVRLAEPSQTAISRNPQLFSTATASPGATASYEPATPSRRRPAMLIERRRREKAASAPSSTLVARLPKRSTAITSPRTAPPSRAGRGRSIRTKSASAGPSASAGVPVASAAATGAKTSRPWNVALLGWSWNCVSVSSTTRRTSAATSDSTPLSGPTRKARAV